MGNCISSDMEFDTLAKRADEQDCATDVKVSAWLRTPEGKEDSGWRGKFLKFGDEAPLNVATADKSQCTIRLLDCGGDRSKGSQLSALKIACRAACDDAGLADIDKLLPMESAELHKELWAAGKTSEPLWPQMTLRIKEKGMDLYAHTPGDELTEANVASHACASVSEFGKDAPVCVWIELDMSHDDRTKAEALAGQLFGMCKFGHLSEVEAMLFAEGKGPKHADWASCLRDVELNMAKDGWVRECVDLSAGGEDGYSPLTTACETGNRKIVFDLLLAVQKQAALRIAETGNPSVWEQHQALLDFMLKATGYGQSALAFAAFADPHNQRDKNSGESVAKTREELVSVLLERFEHAGEQLRNASADGCTMDHAKFDAMCAQFATRNGGKLLSPEMKETYGEKDAAYLLIAEFEKRHKIKAIAAERQAAVGGA